MERPQRRSIGLIILLHRVTRLTRDVGDGERVSPWHHLHPFKWTSSARGLVWSVYEMYICEQKRSRFPTRRDHCRIINHASLSPSPFTTFGLCRLTLTFQPRSPVGAPMLFVVVLVKQDAVTSPSLKLLTRWGFLPPLPSPVSFTHVAQPEPCLVQRY